MSTILEGTVERETGPVGTAYVRLLDATGHFTAEVAADEDGGFRFFASPGDWTVRVVSRLGVHDFPVQAEAGVNEVHALVSI